MKAPSRSVRRVVLAVFAAAGAVLTLSCTDASTNPTGPARDGASANASLLGGILNGLHILQCTPQSAESVTQVIGGGGGSITVGGNTLVIPNGALSGPTTITATTQRVNRREVDFEPHGLVFKKPATLTMDYSGCSLVSKLLPKTIVYTSDNLDPLELILSLDNLLSQTVSGPIGHFSNYVVWQ